MTIFRLYSENGHYAGFWVQQRRRPNVCARVVSVDGRGCGVLPEGAELRVDYEVALERFDVRSGRRLHDEPPPARDASYVRIAEPPWYRPRSETRDAQTRSR